jgi:predicted amidohydrolase
MPTGEPYNVPEMELFRRARAIENSVYVISSNHGVTLGSPRPEGQQRGHSIIIDFKGRILQIIDGTGEAITTAEIDIESLRRHKRNLSPGNSLPRLRASLYAKFYSKANLWPLNLGKEKPLKDRAEALETMTEVIKKFYS